MSMLNECQTSNANVDCQCWMPMSNAIVECQCWTPMFHANVKCQYWVPMFHANVEYQYWMPMLNFNVECQFWMLNANVECQRWMPMLNADVECQCWMPMLNAHLGHARSGPNHDQSSGPSKNHQIWPEMGRESTVWLENGTAWIARPIRTHLAFGALPGPKKSTKDSQDDQKRLPWNGT